MLLRPTIWLGCVFGCALTVGAQDLGRVLLTTSVCDLLREPAKFNGDTIAIRGIYFPTDHGLYLAGDGCDEVRSAGGKDWPALISIVMGSEDIRSRGRDPERLKDVLNQIGTAMIRGAAARAPGAKKTSRVMLTFVGVLETRDGLKDSRGYGNAGAAGQLFVDSVRDIVVEFEGPAPQK
jgi:hypothetical protein